MGKPVRLQFYDCVLARSIFMLSNAHLMGKLVFRNHGFCPNYSMSSQS